MPATSPKPSASPAPAWWMFHPGWNAAQARRIAISCANSSWRHGRLSNPWKRSRMSLAESRALNSYPHRPGRARPFRPVRRPLRRRDADAADPRAGAGLCDGARPTRRSRPSSTSARTHYAGRPSPLYFAERLTEHLGGAKIYFKRDELNHTGSHKINNCLGQILLARRMGKTRIIAETGAGQHGVAAATVARALRPALRHLYGRDRHRAAAAQRLPHEAARRRGEAGHLGHRHAQGRDERGAARLGRECARHLLHHRHGRGPASLSGDGARFPVGDRQRDARADAGARGPPARYAGRLHRRRLERHGPVPSFPRRPQVRSMASRPAATGSTSRTATPPR